MGKVVVTLPPTVESLGMKGRNIAAFAIVMAALAFGYGFKTYQEANGVMYPTFKKEFSL